MHRRLSALVLAAAVTLLAACGSDQATVPVVHIGHANHDHHAPLYVAAMHPEHFAARGGTHLRELEFRRHYELVVDGRTRARLRVEASTGGAELVRRLAEQQLDMTFGGVPAMLAAIDQGEDLRIVAPVMAEGAGLVVGNHLPMDSWEGFVARARDGATPLRIGYKTAVSVQNLIFERALEASGLSYARGLDDPEAAVALINLHGPQNLIPALETGLVDGFVVMQPYLALSEHQGVGRTLAMLQDLPPAGRWKGHPCCALAAGGPFLERNRELAIQITALMLRAQAFVAERPERCAPPVAHWLDLPEAVERRSLPTIRFDVGLDEAWHRGVDIWVQAMVDTERLQGRVKEAHGERALQPLVYDHALYAAARRALE